MLSQTAEYALRAMVHLARTAEEGIPVQADEIAGTLGVPKNYLSKILHVLARRGLLRSTPGPGGGFHLALPPEALPLDEIVAVFDPQLLAEQRQCLLGQTICSDRTPCPAHDRWKTVSGAVLAFFTGTTLGDLAGTGDPAVLFEPGAPLTPGQGA